MGCCAKSLTPAASPGLHATDLIWTYPWTRPGAVELSGTTFVGGVESDGHIVVKTPSTRHQIRLAEVDDHNQPAILTAPGKQTLLVYCRHNVDPLIRIRRAPEGTMAFGSESTVALDPGINTTYAELFHESGDTVHLFVRANSEDWMYLRSTDWGANWSTPISVISRAFKWYFVGANASGTLRFAICGNPPDSTGTVDQSIYYGELDLASGDVSAGGVVLGNVQDGTNLPLDVADLEAVSAPGLGYNTRVMDVSTGPDPEVLFSQWETTTIANSVQRYAVKVAGTWTVRTLGATGARIGYLLTSNYTGGATFPATTSGGRLWWARESSGTWSVEEWTTTTSGATWDSVTLASSSTKLFRPQPVYRQSSGPEVVWCAGTYADLTYTDYLTDARFPAT